MRILILGGTRFLGRALVEAALAQRPPAYPVQPRPSDPGIFSEVEQLHGDRDGGLTALAGRSWDAVIDTCGYVPRIVRQSAELLAPSVEHYTFVSTLSVYADARQPGITEAYPLGRLADESVEEITGETYGPLKVLCESAVEQAFPGRALVVRPGLIVGPHDFSDRFSYWPYRLGRGGEVLAPGRPSRPVQFIDVRDLAEWLVRMVEARQAGVFNAGGAAGILTMQALLEACRREAGSQAQLTWVSESFLLGQGVEPWTELPLWIPESDPDSAGFFTISSQKAEAAGLSYRPLGETIRATLDWLAERPADRPWHAGLEPERERQLLELWHSESPA